MAITLPQRPVDLPADTYPARHRVWWEQCDVLLRDEGERNRLAAIAASEAHAAAQQATADAMLANVTATQAMATAVSGMPSGSGLTESFVLTMMRLVLDKPDPVVP